MGKKRSRSSSKTSDRALEPRKRHRSSSSDSSSKSPVRKKRLKTSGKKKEKKRSRSSSSSSSSCSSNSSTSRKKKRKSERAEKRKLKKEKKKLKKKLRKEKKKKKEAAATVSVAAPVVSEPIAEKKTEPPSPTIGPSEELAAKSKSMAPMTKEEWEKKQSVVKRVLDEESGRYRLIKGDGEVLEEIVSRDRHREINKQATKGDGAFFQAKLAANTTQ